MNELSERIILEKFILHNPELNKLENMLDQFNGFETLGIVNTEIRHSNVIAWLLNPKENHGIGDNFLKEFLKYFISRNKELLEGKVSLFEFEVLNYSDVEIRREWNNIDILIIIKELNKKFVVIIENKVNSTEHDNQLQRYRKIIEDEFHDYTQLYIYLTPEEMDPSDDKWINLNYNIIADLIDNIIMFRKDMIAENVYNFIKQYNTVLRRYIVGDSEIEQICRQIYSKHSRALDLIFQYKPDIYAEISEYLQKQLKGVSQIILDDCSKTQIRFAVKDIDDVVESCGSWTSSNRILLFDFSNDTNTNNKEKLNLELIIGPGNEVYRNKIYDFCKNQPNIFKCTSKIMNKWQVIYKMEFLKKSDYEDATIEDLRCKIDKKLEKFLQDDLVKICDVFKNKWNKN